VLLYLVMRTTRRCSGSSAWAGALVPGDADDPTVLWVVRLSGCSCTWWCGRPGGALGRPPERVLLYLVMRTTRRSS